MSDTITGMDMLDAPYGPRRLYGRNSVVFVFTVMFCPLVPYALFGCSQHAAMAAASLFPQLTAVSASTRQADELHPDVPPVRVGLLA